MKPCYLFVIDSVLCAAYRYEFKDWDSVPKSIEDFLDERGHWVSNCDWMVTPIKKLNKTIIS